MMISLVVAHDVLGGIGKDNKLLWHLPNDLLHFKKLTSGHTVIMGRKTYESIGKPLPNRTNIVLTRDVDYLRDSEPEDVYVYNNFDDLLYEIDSIDNDEEVFVIGGAEIYELFLPYADRVYATLIHEIFYEADTFFPLLSAEEWVLDLGSIDFHEPDSKNMYAHAFRTYDRL